MRNGWLCGIAVMLPLLCAADLAHADEPTTTPSDNESTESAVNADADSGTVSAAMQKLMGPVEPLRLMNDTSPDSVYAPPAPAREDEGVNNGGVHFDLSSRFLDRYLFRGIIRFRNQKGGNNLNFQLDGKLSFDAGKLPHPFIDTFVNIDDDDSVSRFQEVRPTIGFEWNLKPLLISLGYIDYLFPEREKTNDTQEVFLETKFDDSRLWHTERPLLTPYLYTAYDFERYNGWYFEAGISHDIPFEDYGLNFQLIADVGFVLDNPLFRFDTLHDTGFQHYDLGLISTYSLNHFFAVSKRFGEFDLVGYLYYTNGIETNLRADTELWGGAGLNFSY